MGDYLSKPNPNTSSSPSSQPTTTTMPSSNPTQTHFSTPQTDPTHQPKSQESSDPPPMENVKNNPENDVVLEAEEKNENLEEEEEEEEGECGFCLFMKGGGCRDEFIEWEKCVEEGEKNKEDIVDKCFEVTRALKECMQAHSDYYAPILRAEEAAEAEAAKELEKEKERERKEGGEGKLEKGSVSESVAMIEVESGGNLDGSVKKEAS